MGDGSNHKVHGSIVASDTVAPTISSIAIALTSDPGDEDTYGKGEAIEVTATFSKDVTVTVSPQLELDFEGTAKIADYSRTIGDEVVFNYTVVLDDSDADGIAISANKLTLNGGTIQDAAGNDATLTHSALSADADHFVKGAGGS